MPMPKKKLVFIALIVILALIIFYWFTSLFRSAEITYTTVPVKRGDMEVSVLATGILKPSRLVAVGARATGRIVALKVQSGSLVKEGDLLAEIDPTTQENDLKSAEAALANNKAQLAEQEAQLKLAEQNFVRQQKMISTHAISKAEFDDADAQVKIRLAQIDALKAQISKSEIDVETARVNLGYTKVTAPFNGTVLATVVQEGQNVNAVQSAPTIAIIGDLTTMTVRAEISEADIINVQPGQELYFTVIGNPDRRYNGKLESIEPAPEEIRADISFNSNTTSSTSSSAIYYNGIFNIDNRDGLLRTYMTAEVHIIQGQAKDALLISSDGLGSQEKDGSYKVHVLEDNGSVVVKNVKIGLNNKVVAQVLSGLKENEKIITGSSDTLGGKASSKRDNRNGKMGRW